MLEMKTGLEVFDFNEEDEVPGKFLNPSIRNPAILKRELLEPASQEVGIVKNKTITDANDGHIPHNSSSNGSQSSFGIREDPATPDTAGGAVAAQKSQSPTLESAPGPKMDRFESNISFTEVQERFSCDEAPSPGNFQSAFAPVASTLNSESVNVKSDADGSDENSPSSSISNIAEDDGIVDGRSSDSFFSAHELDAINVPVDYVLYGENYCFGCMVIFSSDGIKMSGISAYGEQENVCFERGIDDMIRIESHQFQRSGTVTVKLHFLPKDAAQDVHTDGVELLEFALMDPNWSAKFEEITSLNVKYLALSSFVRDMDVSIDGGEDIFRRRPYFPTFEEAVEDVVYPKGDSDAVSISKRDFDLLQPETFVNDTIIDFYIKYLKNQIPPEERHRYHFFNSFFFRKLADLDKDPSSASDGRAAFLRVHKWTRKVDIFGKDYIFIPVNFSLHWSLLVICHPSEIAGFKDEDSRKSSRVPCILHMDSIKGTHAGLKNLMQSYLWEEWKARQKDTSDDLSTTFLNLRFVSLELPQQENSFDCGLFLLHYLELFLAEAPPNFSPFKINKFSKFLTVDWFPPAEASLKRTLIQRLISGLLDNHTRDLSFAECSDEPESHFPRNNLKETAVELVSERCTSTVACHGDVSGSDPNRGIEITLLQSSMRNIDCVSDPGLVLRELLEPGVAAGSLHAQCSSFDEQSYYHHNGVMSQQLEEDEENEEPFVYFAPGDAIFQQAGNMATQSSSIPYTIRGYGGDPSWKPGENDALSPETSASDDSDVGIIEYFPSQKVEDLCQRDGANEQASHSTEKPDCMEERLVSICNDEILESSECKIGEDLNMMCDGNENSNFSFSQEDLSVIHTGFKMVENGLHQLPETNLNSEDVQTVGGDSMAKPDEVMAEPDENRLNGSNKEAEPVKETIEGEMVAELDERLSNDCNIGNESENQTVEGNSVAELSQKQSNNSDMVLGSDEMQTIETNTVAESDENQLKDSKPTQELIEDSNVELGGNLKRESEEMQSIEGSKVVENSDEIPATKRRRVDEGEDSSGNGCEDLLL